MSIVRRSGERKHAVAERRFDGPGQVAMTKLIETDAELLGKGRLYNDTVLEKDCGIGYHVHQGDAEFYYMLEGEAEYNDNGTLTTIYPGDFTMTFPGEGHGITNRREEPVRFIALILYQ